MPKMLASGVAQQLPGDGGAALGVAQAAAQGEHHVPGRLRDPTMRSG